MHSHGQITAYQVSLYEPSATTVVQLFKMLALASPDLRISYNTLVEILRFFQVKEMIG